MPWHVYSQRVSSYSSPRGQRTGSGDLRKPHLCSSSLASWPRAWISSLVLLGLMALTSSGPTCSSTGPTASESRGTIMVPLLLRLGSFGRAGFGARLSRDAPDDESDQSGLELFCEPSSPIVNCVVVRRGRV